MALSGGTRHRPATPELRPGADIENQMSALSDFRPLYPQQPTFWTRLGMSQVDPKQTFMVLDAKSMPSNNFRARWGVFPSPVGVVIDRLSLYHRR